MERSSSTSPRTPALAFANAFGALGYMSLIFQWAWALLLLSYPYIESGEMSAFLLPKHQQPPATAATPEPVSPLLTILAIIVTAFVLALTIFVIVRLPKTIGLQGSKAAKATARTVIPILTHHQPISKKERIRLSYRLVMLLKGIAIILPLCTIPFATRAIPLPHSLIVAVTIFCATCSVIWFGLQYLVARLKRLDISRLW